MGAKTETLPGEMHSGAGPAKAHVAGTEGMEGASGLLEVPPLPFLSLRKLRSGARGRSFPEYILSEPRPGGPPPGSLPWVSQDLKAITVHLQALSSYSWNPCPSLRPTLSCVQGWLGGRGRRHGGLTFGACRFSCQGTPRPQGTVLGTGAWSL